MRPAQLILRSFGAGKTSRLTGVPYRTLDFWAKSNFVSPSIESAAGKGTARAYSFRDLVALRVAKRLRDAGVSLQSLRKAVAYVQHRGGLASPSEALSSTFLVWDGHDVFEKSGAEIISMLENPGQMAFAWIVDLGSVVEEIKLKIAA